MGIAGKMSVKGCGGQSQEEKNENERWQEGEEDEN